MATKSLIIALALCHTNIATGAIIALRSATDGSNQLILNGATGEWADMNLVIITSKVDTYSIGWMDVYLKSSSDTVDVYDLEGGQEGWRYIRPFGFPAELEYSEDYDSYVLYADNLFGGPALPPGEATYIMDALSLGTTASEGRVEASFPDSTDNLKPLVCGPWCSGTFTVAPYGFPPNIPNVLYLGDETSTNPPFVITLIPEPAGLVYLGMASIALLRWRGLERGGRGSDQTPVPESARTEARGSLGSG